MHGVYFGKVAPEGSPGSHLNPADWLKLGHSLGQCSIAGLFPLFLREESGQSLSQSLP